MRQLGLFNLIAAALYSSVRFGNRVPVLECA
jgi:hypothetical protein